MKTAFEESTLWLTKDNEIDKSVTEFIRGQAADSKDLLCWLEPALQLNPDNSTGKLKEFSPFIKGSLPTSLPKLEAAYLFWKSSDNKPIGLHIVATKNGCRWCRFQTWQSEDKNAEKITVHKRDSYPVLARQDFVRFFGNNKPNWSQAIGKLKVTEYWTEEGLLVWWLKEEKDNGNG